MEPLDNVAAFMEEEIMYACQDCEHFFENESCPIRLMLANNCCTEEAFTYLFEEDDVDGETVWRCLMQSR